MNNVSWGTRESKKPVSEGESASEQALEVWSQIVLRALNAACNIAVFLQKEAFCVIS